MKPMQEKMLTEHLPYRLSHLDGLCWACRIIQSNKFKSRLAISFNGANILFPNMRPLTNALVETGIIYCRVLMNFLGIKLDSGKLVAIDTNKLKDDFNISKLNLKQLKVADVKSAPTSCDSKEIELACAHTLRSANKAVAHFTKEEARAWSSDSWAYRDKPCSGCISGDPLPISL